MRVKTIVNVKGGPQVSKVMTPLEGGGGAAGMQAVTNLTKFIECIQESKSRKEVEYHYYMICGYAICCKECGFLTEKSHDDLMHLVEHIVEIEMHRLNIGWGK